MLVRNASAVHRGPINNERIGRHAIHTGRYNPSYKTIGKNAIYLSNEQGSLTLAPFTRSGQLNRCCKALALSNGPAKFARKGQLS
jgi:hypothetical protein